MKTAVINLTKFVEEISIEEQDVSKQDGYSDTYKAGINEGLRLAGIIVEESFISTISEANKKGPRK